MRRARSACEVGTRAGVPVSPVRGGPASCTGRADRLWAVRVDTSRVHRAPSGQLDTLLSRLALSVGDEVVGLRAQGLQWKTIE